MTALGEYIAGRGEAPSRRELNRLADRYEWFTTARRVRAIVTGEVDPALALPMIFWPTVPPVLRKTAVESPSLPARDVAADLIDRFIEHGGYRIDPGGEAHEANVDIDIDPGMVTEELAEIYRAQGMEAEAEKIYSILKSN